MSAKKQRKAKKTKPSPLKAKKFVALYGRCGVDYCVDNENHVFDTIEDALEELREWIYDAEEAKREGDDPEFRLYEATELQLSVTEEHEIKIKVDLP